jgi:hypothetical protein
MAENVRHTRLDPDPRGEAVARDEAPEARWPARRRFLVILGAATLCWLLPALIVGLLLSLR